jgi:hypothetical protein
MYDFSKKFADYHLQLDPSLKLPAGISLINPYQDPQVKKTFSRFCKDFYKSDSQRILIAGINPGRFGAGVTGVPFTDPVALEEFCSIPNEFAKKRELSSRFIYDMIAAMGGPDYFYKKFVLNAVCPLGFLKGIKNYNYYDEPNLLRAAAPLIRESLLTHAQWNISHDVVISLGKKNASFLEAFNSELKLFRKIIVLEHPRFIMQYRLKKKQEYIEQYCRVLREVIS